MPTVDADARLNFVEAAGIHSTVTLFAKFRGRSTLQPRSRAM
jgi:hypothetical protein